MALLIDYLEIFNVMPRLSFDLSLARGLDYYTGVIYEVVTEASAPPAGKSAAKKRGPKPPSKDDHDPDADRSNDDTVGVGSIAAGGRYDELVGMFSNSAKGRIPCVGISFGVDRIFSIAKARIAEDVRGNEVDVYVMAFGGKGFTGLVKERMNVCKTLWDAGIKVN
jgi:histidyl-tRNA synthetase